MKAVDAVKTKAEIELVESLLRKHKGGVYGDLWRFGLNTALRISDLLGLKYQQFDMDKRVFELREQKTQKNRIVRLNNTAMGIIQKRQVEYPTDIYLFQAHSNRTASMGPKPLNRVTVARAFSEIGDILKVNLGTHSMRKSMGWAMHSDGVPIEKIAMFLNHSTPAVTMRYLGITKEEVLQMYDEYEI
jgi:integrase